MSEDEAIRAGSHEDKTDEVEGHLLRAGANEEAPAEGDDDVEAHVKRANTPKKL